MRARAAFTLLFLLPFAALVLPSAPACAGSESVAPPPDPLLAEPAHRAIVLPAEASQFALPFTPKALTALDKRDYDLAETLITGLDMRDASPQAQKDRDFVLAWLRMRLGRKNLALPLYDSIDESSAPQAYKSMLKAQMLLARGQDEQAIEILRTIDLDDGTLGVRAQLLLGQTLSGSGRATQAREIYERLIERPDPARGSSSALFRLASMEKPLSELRYEYLRRIWTAYPTSDESTEAARLLKAFEAKGARYKTSWQHAALRADALQDEKKYKEAIDLMTPHLARILNPAETAPEACVGLYAVGRAQHKTNKLTDSLKYLVPAGERCVTSDAERGAKALYLAGKSSERLKLWAQAGATYERIPTLYPKSNLADDGHAYAGITLAEAGDLEGARANWSLQVEVYPDGDLSGEAWLRLALNAYRAGHTAQAIHWASRGQQAMGLQGTPMYHWALEYWAARWMLWPDYQNPAALTQDPDRLEHGIEAMARFYQDHPGNVYSILAASRLAEVAPERLASLNIPEWREPIGPWTVTPASFDEPHYHNALALARLGLFGDSLTEWRRVDLDTMGSGEIGLYLELMTASGAWLWAHDQGRTWVLDHPGELMGPNRVRLLALTHPLAYDKEVRSACQDYPWDFRAFHALVREESTFNASISSHVGAGGLSQLMPATARIVGKWMKMKVTRASIYDPATNLKIGARYFEFLADRYRGNPFLSMAGYNAGEGSVDRWLREKGNRPADEFIESIPFRETRHYVKRVSTTWQTYHLLYDSGSPWLGYPAYNHQAVPDIPTQRSSSAAADSGLGGSFAQKQ